MFSEDRPVVTVDEVIDSTGLSQTSAYRYLSLLREVGLIQLQSTGSFVLTQRVRELAAAAEDSIALEKVATPTLKWLSEQTHETAFIMTRNRNEASFVASWEPDRSLTLSFRAGAASPLHKGAVAKILLAYSAQTFQKNYLGRFVTDREERVALARDLEMIRSKGYAESLSEVDEGIWGGAVPIVLDDAVIGSLSIAGPAFRINVDERAKIISTLKSASEELSRDLRNEAEAAQA